MFLLALEICGLSVKESEKEREKLSMLVYVLVWMLGVCRTVWQFCC